MKQAVSGSKTGNSGKGVLCTVRLAGASDLVDDPLLGLEPLLVGPRERHHLLPLGLRLQQSVGEGGVRRREVGDSVTQNGGNTRSRDFTTHTVPRYAADARGKGA